MSSQSDQHVSDAVGKPRRPTDGIRYGESEYWEEKYAKNGNMIFDWYLTYAEMKELVNRHIPRLEGGKLLMVGCGNSPMAEHMYLDGYNVMSTILSVDISESVIKQMQQRASELQMTLDYMCQDCRNMSNLASETFDFIMDKGTMDALVCGDEYDKDIPAMVRDCFRLLKVGGLYMVVSFGAPAHRKPFFDDIIDKCEYLYESWTNPSKPNDPQVYNVYLLRKKPAPSS